jgi:phenylalanyl-tRNA synthetase alpha chain
MIDKIKQLEDNVKQQLQKIASAQELEQFRIAFLSRKGQLANLFADLAQVPKELRPKAGEALNRLKQALQQEYDRLAKTFSEQVSDIQHDDLTLPGRKIFTGRKHPLTIVQDEIKFIFHNMGFRIEDGPEIESDYYNFEALNIPKNHPARDMQDTLYITDDIVLRTHTSPVQIRVMERTKPPIRIIAPGRVYRRDTPDASHSPFFHQVEGLVVDQGISFSDLKGVIAAFAHKMFGSDTKVRFRPSFFPFTEPSAEYDFNCVFCKGQGCRVCKQTGWMEISGAGMVDPNVFAAVGYDAEKYTGYAFGMGVDRIAMLKYGIDDIRLFFENDLRFLEQFQ